MKAIESHRKVIAFATKNITNGNFCSDLQTSDTKPFSRLNLQAASPKISQWKKNANYH